MSLPQKFHEGKLYNYASEEIRCNADKEGAEVFEIKVGSSWNGNQITFLILSHDEKLAQQKATEEHPEYCERCDSIRCWCSDHHEED